MHSVDVDAQVYTLMFTMLPISTMETSGNLLAIKKFYFLELVKKIKFIALLGVAQDNSRIDRQSLSSAGGAANPTKCTFSIQLNHYKCILSLKSETSSSKISHSLLP